MSDTPAPTPSATLDRLGSLTSDIATEMQERAAKVARMEALRTRAMDLKTVWDRLQQEVSDIETAFKAEVGQ